MFINQHETGSFPGFLDAWLAGFGMPAHLSYDASADHAAIAANRQSYGVAWPTLDFRAARADRLVRRRFPRRLGREGSAAARLRRRAREARRRAAARLRRSAPLAHRPQRRSVDRVQAGQRAGDRRACSPAADASRCGSAGRRGVAAPALQALAREFAATTPSLVLAGGGGADALEVALAANALNQSRGNVGVTIKPAEGYHGFEGMASPAELRALAERMNAGGVSLLIVRGANPAFTLPKSAGFADAMAKVPFKVSFSSYPDETTELCDLDSSRPPLARAVGRRGAGARNDLAPAAGDGSGLRHARDGRRAHRARAEGSRRRLRAIPSTDYRSWLIADFPAARRRSPPRSRRGIACRLAWRSAPTRAPVPAVRAAAPIEQSSGDIFLVVYPHPCSATDAARTSRGCRSCPIPSRRSAGDSWVEMHPATAKRLGIERGDIVDGEDGGRHAHAAGASSIWAFAGDTIAIAIGQGHTARWPLRRRHGSSIRSSFCPALRRSRSAASAFVSTKANVSKAAGPRVARDHRRLGAPARPRHRQAIAIADLRAGRRARHRRTARRERRAERAEVRTASAAEASTEEMPGDASHAFLPGLRSPVAADAQGELGADRGDSARTRACTIRITGAGWPSAAGR